MQTSTNVERVPAPSGVSGGEIRTRPPIRFNRASVGAVGIQILSLLICGSLGQSGLNKGGEAGVWELREKEKAR